MCIAFTSGEIKMRDYFLEAIRTIEDTHDEDTRIISELNETVLDLKERIKNLESDQNDLMDDIAGLADELDSLRSI